MLGKIQKKSQNSYSIEDSRSPKESRRGATPRPGALLARPRGWSRPLAAWARGATPQAPLWPIFTSRSRNPRESSVTRFRPLFHRRRDSDLGIARRTCPDTMPDGGLTSGGLSITMIASGMRRE